MSAVYDYIQNIQNTPFQWGRFDCYTFAFEILAIVHPNNSLPDFRGRYSTDRDALKILEKNSWLEHLNDCFFVEILSKDNTLIDYDLVLFRHNGFECMHIILDDRVYSVRENARLISFHRECLKLLSDKILIRINGLRDLSGSLENLVL